MRSNKCNLHRYGKGQFERVLEMTGKFMTDPIRILVKRDELTLEGIKQFFVAVEKEEWKFDTLVGLYKL